MKRSLMLAALAATTLTACGGAPVDKTGRVPTIITLTGDATAGAKVYTDTCAGCHGPDGKGQMARAIVADVPVLSTTELATIALNGVGLMGPAGANLTDQQVADLVTWVKANVK